MDPKPHVLWWTHFCVSPPETSCLLLDPKMFFMDSSPLETSCFLMDPKSSWLLLDPLFFHPPKTSCLLLDTKTSCHSMNPQLHVFWWTGSVHQKTWVPNISVIQRFVTKFSYKIISIRHRCLHKNSTSNFLKVCLPWFTTNLILSTK